MAHRSFDQEEFLQELCDRLIDRFPNIHYYVKFLNSPDDPTDGKSRKQEPATPVDLARALTIEIPPLRRVLTFWMWMSRDFARNVVGITDEELEEIKEKVFDNKIYLAYSTIIEQWNTHTVISPGSITDSGRPKTIYEREPWKELGKFYPIWRHAFETIDGPSKGGSLEVAFHQNAIKCWARYGRFGSGVDCEAQERYQFITIPLDEEKLKPFLRPDDPEDGDETDWYPRERYVSEPGYKEYRYEDNVKRPAFEETQVPSGIVDESGKPILKSEKIETEEEAGVGWILHVQDNIARAIDLS
jgi:hypothetical protein